MSRMYQVILQLSELPGQGLLEGVLNVLAEHNCRWYLRQWATYRDPPGDPTRAGVRWRPDAPGMEALFQDAPIVFRRRWASCGPIAAISVGYARAVERLRGMSAPRSRDLHRVVLLPQGRVRGGRQWHAYHLANHQLVDPTRHMRRI
ncbi:MAG: hypothetical protein K0V04_31605 [Deltaproteobacteria bacterium]|nr:hypothetical protein [Deltaproteobacteria bacterium]